MRNFPHQINQISKISESLRIASELLSRGDNIGADGVFGYAVLRRGIYNFRGLSAVSDDALEEAIILEKRKPVQNQGPRTFARDLRRTLQLLNFIRQDVSDYSITQLGENIIRLPDPPDVEATNIWIESLAGLTLEDSNNSNTRMHPAINMLRIILARPDIEKKWLAFAFDMGNDSDNELNRILQLLNLDFDSALHIVGASEYTAANAVKIVPSLLQQIGLIAIDNGNCNITETGLRLINPDIEINDRTNREPRIRNSQSGFTIDNPDDVPEHRSRIIRERTTEEQVHSAAILDERTSKHQELVRKIIEMLRNSEDVEDVRITDYAFDILFTLPKRNEWILVEVKTLRGDALIQGRNALGQLLFYEFFDVRPISNDAKVVRIAAFDNNPGKQVIDFLAANNTLCLVVSSDNILIPDGYDDCFVVR
jgi:hypothetical protein